MLRQIIEWWNRPSARQRILDVLSATDWQRGLDVRRTAGVDASFYFIVIDLEDEGLIESKWEEGPLDPSRGGYRRRLYRKVS